MRFTFKIIDAYSFQIYSGHIVLIKKIGFKIKNQKNQGKQRLHHMI